MSENGAPGRILIVDDDEMVRSTVSEMLTNAGHTVFVARDAREAKARLEHSDTEIVVLDLGLPDIDGLDLLPQLLEIGDQPTIIVQTGRGGIAPVIEAMKRGAETFLAKPVDMETLLTTVAKALRKHRLMRQAIVAKEHSSLTEKGVAPSSHELVGSSEAMQDIRELIKKVATTDSSIVLCGESGSGKGIVARIIHSQSRRSQGPFVNLSCAALPGTLVESEVFGYEPGAFTDAKTRKPGLLELANHGTFFMDEIAELEASAQSKLLKVIEEKTYRRLGGVRDVVVDVRFIVATHVDLADLVKRGAFRRDLFYRLNVMQIMIPPLRERDDDVLELAYRFISELNPQVGRRIRQISDPAAELLQRYSWPGNVRELRNVIERAMILCMGEVIMPAHLPPDIKDVRRDETLASVETLDQIESAHIEKVLGLTRGNMKLAAELLGISRSTLYAKLERYKLVNPAALADEGGKSTESHSHRRR